MKSILFASAIVLLGLARASWAAPVTVQVLGPDKLPVAGAQVRALLWSSASLGQKAEPLQAVTDAKGAATIEAPDDPEAEARGSLGWVTAWSEGLSIATAPLKKDGNVVALGAVGVARGLVVDAQGKPVAGAVVRLAGIDRAGEGAGGPVFTVFHSTLDAEVCEVRSDALGRWSIGRVPLGSRVSLWLAEDKFAPTNAIVPVAEAGAAFSWAPIEAKARLAVANPGDTPNAREIKITNEDGVLMVRPGGTITARVLGPNGKPVVGVRVWAGRANSATSAVTDAKGEIRITRLSEGEYTLTTQDANTAKNIEWVAGKPLKVTVGAGATVDAGEMKMIRGATIQVRLLDEATGKGILGAQVSAHATINQTRGREAMGTSDAEGLVTLRVEPGKQNVMVREPLPDYVVPEYASSFFEGTAFDVADGGAQEIVWKLKKALHAAGRVLDEKGQPVPNISIHFRSSKEDWWHNIKEAKGDAGGNWKLGGAPGVWKPYIQGAEWKVVAPKEITLPHTGALDITIAPIARIAVNGKAVDGAGAGLPDVHVALQIQTQQDGMGAVIDRAATTGADGTWSVADVPESAEAITIKVSRAGFAIDRVPAATRGTDAKTWAITEARLLKRDSRLAGKVLNAGGQPVAGAQVLVAGTLLTLDKEGRWSLGELPAGDTEVVAVDGNLWAVATTIAPNDSVSLRLKAPQVLAERDVERALAVLDDAWQTSRGAQYAGRSRIPATLAAADPDAALAMAQTEKKDAWLGINPHVLAIVRAVVQGGDLELAQRWTTAHLDALPDPHHREQAILLLGQALADTDAASAKKWLALAQAGFGELTENWQRISSAREMAALAARLKVPDANALFEQALSFTQRGDNGGQSDFSGLARAVAPQREEWAQKVIEAAIAAKPGQLQSFMGPDDVVGNALLAMAPVNLPAARRLLLKYGDLKGPVNRGPSWQIWQARMVMLGERAKAGEDVDVLAKEALELPQNQVRALFLIAQNGPQGKRVEGLKRALAEAEKQIQLYDNLTGALQVLAHLLPLDHEAAKAGLERARAILEAPRNPSSNINRLRASEVANWAWLYRSFDPAASRLMIEREWSRAMSLALGGQSGGLRWPEVGQLAHAMMPLDIERAQQLAERLPIEGYEAPAFDAQRAIARWMLANQKERDSKPLSFWSRDIEQDASYSPEW